MAVRPVDLGFAEFVATLLSETVESVVASATDQEHRHAELRSLARLDVSNFAQTHVGQVEIDQLAVQLLGREISAGAQVLTKAEQQFLGVELKDGDLDGRRLTEQGSERVRDTLSLTIARERQAALREALDQGIPRVIVDQGRMVAKLSMQVVAAVDDGPEEEPGPSSTARPGTSPVGSLQPGFFEILENPALAEIVSVRPEQPVVLASLLTNPGVSTPSPATSPSSGALAAHIPSAIRDLRLAVRPAGSQPAETADSAASLLGEIELTFRTIY